MTTETEIKSAIWNLTRFEESDCYAEMCPECKARIKNIKNKLYDIIAL